MKLNMPNYQAKIQANNSTNKNKALSFQAKQRDPIVSANQLSRAPIAHPGKTLRNLGVIGGTALLAVGCAAQPLPEGWVEKPIAISSNEGSPELVSGTYLGMPYSSQKQTGFWGETQGKTIIGHFADPVISYGLEEKERGTFEKQGNLLEKFLGAEQEVMNGQWGNRRISNLEIREEEGASQATETIVGSIGDKSISCSSNRIEEGFNPRSVINCVVGKDNFIITSKEDELSGSVNGVPFNLERRTPLLSEEESYLRGPSQDMQTFESLAKNPDTAFPVWYYMGDISRIDEADPH